MKISIDALSPKSIDAAIKKLGDYSKWIEVRAKVLCERLAERGLEVAGVEFGSAIYDGTNDVKVRLYDDGKKMRVLAEGETVLFIEFGTGVTHQTYHPKRNEMGMNLEIGGYGHGLGRLNGGWRYPEAKGAGTYGEKDPKHPGYIHTYGNPANMPMYNASQDIRNEMLRIAREVFQS